MFITGV